MAKSLLGKKIGMTRLYGEDGADKPVTIVALGPCFVTQVKTADVDGYEAVQIGYDEQAAGRSTMPIIGHDAKAGVAPQRVHREVRLAAGEAAGYEAGQALSVEIFEDVKFVDVIGTSKGKGFQGGMKRWGYAGLEASHGVERKHRCIGSIGGRSTNRGTGKNKKGIKMPGQMGNVRVTVRNLEVVGVDKEKGLLLVKGALPGANGGLLMVSESKRLWKRKAQLVASAK